MQKPKYINIISDLEYQEIINGISRCEEERIFCKHSFEHCCDVARIMYILALEDNSALSKDVIYATAFLHDIGRLKEYEEGIEHEKAGAEIAEKFLQRYGYKDKEISNIVFAIQMHRSKREENELANYLYKADKLSRTCYSCNAKEKCKWEKDQKNNSLLF